MVEEREAFRILCTPFSVFICMFMNNFIDQKVNSVQWSIIFLAASSLISIEMNFVGPKSKNPRVIDFIKCITFTQLRLIDIAKSRETSLFFTTMKRKVQVNMKIHDWDVSKGFAGSSVRAIFIWLAFIFLLKKFLKYHNLIWKKLLKGIAKKIFKQSSFNFEI